MPSKIRFSVFLWLFASALSLFSSIASATLQYSPATLSYGGFNSQAEYCSAQGSVGGYPYEYQTSGYYSGYCCAKGVDPYGNVFSCDQQYNVHIKVAATATYVCPPDYTRDATKAGTDPQACFIDAPPPPDCSSKIGQTDTRKLQCALLSCPSGFVQDPDGKIGCNGPYTSTRITPPSSATVAGCPAVLTSISYLDPQMRTSVVGSTSGQPVYCNVVYTVTGEPPPPVAPPADPASPPADGLGGLGGGTGGAVGSSAPAGATGTGAGANGDGSGTAGAAGTPCIPTATNPCTGSGVDCVPTLTKPCTSTAKGSGDCIPTPTQPCSSSGSTTAPCDVSPVCTGDGVQCAQVIQTWKSVCELNKNMTDMPAELSSKLSQMGSADGSGDSVVSGARGLLDSHINDFQTAFSSTPSGDCLPDVVIHVLAANITIPVSKACNFLVFLRLLLHLGVDFVALRMIFRSVSGG